MGELNVSIDELIDAGIGAENIADSIERGVNTFAKEVDSLLSEWSGLSATQFDESWADWHEGATSVISALRVSVSLLSDSAQSYANQESTTTDNLGQVTDSL